MPLRFGRSKGLNLDRSRGYICEVIIKPLQLTENVTIIIPYLSFVTVISVGVLLIIRNISRNSIIINYEMFLYYQILSIWINTFFNNIIFFFSTSFNVLNLSNPSSVRHLSSPYNSHYLIKPTGNEIIGNDHQRWNCLEQILPGCP